MSVSPAVGQAIDSFMSNLRVLTRELVRNRPNDAMISRADKRIALGISADPLYVFETVGVYLYKYKDQIYQFGPDAEEFLLNNTFDTELKESVVQEKADLVSYIIPIAKDIARGLPTDRKSEMVTLVAEMLDAYVDYLIEVKENE